MEFTIVLFHLRFFKPKYREIQNKYSKNYQKLLNGMLTSSFIALLVAICFMYIRTKVVDEIEQLITILISLICLWFSWTFSHIPIKVMLILAFVITTQQINYLNRNK